MSGHLAREQIETLLAPEGSRSTRATAVRHLLTGCKPCAALARQVLRENGYRIKGGRVEPALPEPVHDERYDAVFERLLQRFSRNPSKSPLPPKR